MFGSKKYKISIIGAGNVSGHLGPALENAGHYINEVYSRDIKNAEKLASRIYDAVPKDDLDFSQSKSELFIIAVSDDALSTVAGEIILPEGATAAHTSGSVSADVLQPASDNFGIFYPLQTFSKSRNIDFRHIPILIEANDRQTRDILTETAESISKNVRLTDEEERKTLHLAAVFASNFTNHMLKIARDLLDSEELDFDLLKPLVIETVDKALLGNPAKSQTGPAVRKDVKVLREQIEMLKKDKFASAVYKAVTESIIYSAKKSQKSS